MELDLWFFALAVPAVLIAGIPKGGFGSGGAFVAMPLLALKLEPAQALGLILPLLMVVDCWTLRPYWRKWDGRNARALIIGGALGVLLATGFYTIANADLLRVLIGAIALGFVTHQFAMKRGWISAVPRLFSPRLGAFTGVVAGFTSFVSHAGGPPVAMFLLSQSVGKTTYQATTVLVFWAVNLLKAVPYAFLGVFTYDTLRADLMLAPVAVLGAIIGVYMHTRVSERAFFAITYTLLVGAGVKLIYDGLI